MVLLPRTLMEKPLMLAIKNGDGVVDGMKLAASAYNEILRGTLGGGKEFGMLASHDLAGMHALGTANPESFAGYWKRMNDAGGGTAFTQGFTMDENKNALVQAIRSKNANVLVKGGKTYMKYAAGWADALENVSSVGIFRYVGCRSCSQDQRPLELPANGHRGQSPKRLPCLLPRDRFSQ
jgi:hypothetical protein